MAYDMRLVLIGGVVAALILWAWWRLFRHPQYADQPAWVWWAYLTVLVALFVLAAFLWDAIPP